MPFITLPSDPSPVEWNGSLRPHGPWSPHAYAVVVDSTVAGPLCGPDRVASHYRRIDVLIVAAHQRPPCTRATKPKQVLDVIYTSGLVHAGDTERSAYRRELAAAHDAAAEFNARARALWRRRLRRAQRSRERAV